MGDFEVGRTLDDRYPVGDEEYMRWLRTPEAKDFLVDIIQERRPSKRHAAMVTREAAQGNSVEAWIVRMSKDDFLQLEGDQLWMDMEARLGEIMASAGGPPPTIVNGGYGPGQAWGLFDGPEFWYRGCYGHFYQTQALNPEGILQFMQIKFGIDYERAEEEYLRNRYSPEEQEFYDQQLRDQPVPESKEIDDSEHTLNDRYPVGDKEYVRWLKTPEARDFLVDIIREQQPSRRHAAMVTWEAAQGNSVEGWVVRMSKDDFLHLEDPQLWMDMEERLGEIMASAGPPPTIINGGYGPGRVWGLLQGPETWHWGGGYGGFYKTHALNPEGILQFMQIKFGIDYKRAEEEYLKNRYSPEEQKFYDQQRRDQLEAESKEIMADLKRTLDDRFPVGCGELLRWLKTEEARDFLVGIFQERRPSRRHTAMMTLEAQEGRVDGWIENIAKVDFLGHDDDDYQYHEVFGMIGPKILGPLGGPPPSLFNGAGRAWGLLQGPETWYWCQHGINYSKYVMVPEGILQFMQIKFGIDRERAEEEFLRNRYSPEEQEFFNQQLRDRPAIPA